MTIRQNMNYLDGNAPLAGVEAALSSPESAGSMPRCVRVFCHQGDA